MVCYNFKQYDIKGFEVGKGNKKYNALIQHKKTKEIVKIPFGDKRYEQYKDSALGIYSHLDHHDKYRRCAYQKRHKNDNLHCFSPGYFSWFYLW